VLQHCLSALWPGWISEKSDLLMLNSIHSDSIVTKLQANRQAVKIGVMYDVISDDKIVNILIIFQRLSTTNAFDSVPTRPQA
jgi:hypothetical protein